MNTTTRARECPAVFEYSDYRAFLRDYAERKRKSHPGWSYRAWAKHLRLAGPSVLTMVVRGQRSPGKSLSDKLIRYFGFTARQSEYFLDLIRVGKTRDPALRALLVEKLAKAHPGKKFHFLDADTFNAISSWQYYALREMTLLPRFDEDPARISRSLLFPVPAREIRTAMKKLEELRLLERDPATRGLRPAQPLINTTQDVASAALRRFHLQMLDHARQAIQKVPVEEREVIGTTLNIAASKMAEAKDAIRRFHEEFTRQMEAAPGERVYQLNVQLFPLTRKPKETPDEDPENATP